MIALADCAVTVSNARQAAQWWGEKLGFGVHQVGDGAHSVMIAPPGDRFVLHLCEGFAPVEPGNSGIAFMTDDIEQVVLKMTAAGVEFPQPLTKESWGSLAKFADPDGNVYWLLGASRKFIQGELRQRAPGGDAQRARSRLRSKRGAGARAARSRRALALRRR